MHDLINSLDNSTLPFNAKADLNKLGFATGSLLIGANVQPTHAKV